MKQPTTYDMTSNHAHTRLVRTTLNSWLLARNSHPITNSLLLNEQAQCSR